ncbi:ribosomal protein S18 acetylase RimI-like enzyme [Luteibacter sp. Sphag1AF]|uniref:GNAT family N-acetyltransferase n=1 Tax=Luteibacter sp. Sphag1AF TaxID=2587031 RepID=UPI0016216EF0|nr:GNAT family N-acetyltransferase [Luteibacter sp. Sphag1AF]MBB3228844.1 ribosomal protein S18 acetylase RimI-like enzyme [Luteibacter sp. Sphag1AF]
MSATVRVADLKDLDQVAVLFDEYRQFYAQPADASLARRFMESRLSEGSSLVLVGETVDGDIVAFTQLYPLFDSVGAVPSFILYDLFVAQRARRQGIARNLMVEAVNEARRRGAGRLELQTARDNIPAQALYEGLGWKRDNDFFIYAIHP